MESTRTAQTVRNGAFALLVGVLGLLSLLLLAGPAEAQRQATLRWIAPTDQPVDGYVVYLGQSSRSYQDVIDVGFLAPDASGVATTTIQGLQSGVDYYAAVTAYNGAGESSYSNEILLAAGCAPGLCDDGDPCTLDQCDSLGCSYSLAPDGSPCDDGLSGTVGDACAGGICQGFLPQCQVDSDCDDGDACNGLETCQNYSCLAGVPLSCGPATACTTPFCDAASGCQLAPVNDGLSCAGGSGMCIAGSCLASGCQLDADCEDGDPCTGQEACVGNACVAGAPVFCPAPSQCEVGVCVAGVGCASAPAPNGSPCDDGLSGTVGDACSGGVCQGFAQCQLDADCDDGNACNGGETCQGNTCVAGVPLSCSAPSQCTTGFCDAASGCQVAPLLDGALCGNGGGFCTSGTCQMVDCSVGTRRQQERCLEAFGGSSSGCQLDSDCDDGDPCSGQETCQSNVCIPGTPLACPAPSPCEVGVCVAGVGCGGAPVPDGSTCDDGVPWTVADACSGGVCQGVVPQCQANSDCDDGDACNGLETCQSYSCLAGVPLSCSAPSACTTASCDAASGCQLAPVNDGVSCAAGTGVCIAGSCLASGCLVDADCDDGDLCTGQEACVGNLCVAGTPLACPALSQCEVGVCVAGVGCASAPAPNGSACDDGLSGTVGDACSGGVCQGFVPQCQIDAECADGDVCNGVETCQNYSCVLGVPLACNAPTACTTPFCDAVSGCQLAPLADGVSCAGGSGVCSAGSCQISGPAPQCLLDADCDDGDACNGSETCQSNSCAAGVPLSCSASECTVGFCDAVSGCQAAPLLDGALCANGSGICMAGACQMIDCTVGTRRQQDRCMATFYP